MKVILIDDEQYALDFLEKQLLNFSNIEVISKCINPIIGEEEVRNKTVDVVFLDINLPEINGLELAERILNIKPGLTIVFVTAYDEYAVEAFELNAIDYVVKPIRIDRLKKTIERVEKRLNFKEHEKQSTATYKRLNLFSRLTIQKEDNQAELIQWRTAKAQELFLYLLQHHKQPIRKSVLIELFWPEYEPDKAYSQLYTTIYYVRKTLNKFGEYFHIKNTTEGYVLNMNHLGIDVEEWEQAILTAPSLHIKTIDKYVEIMELYTGGYLQDYDYWWAEAKCHRLEQFWLDTAFEIGDFYTRNLKYEDAIKWYLKICSNHPHIEDAHFSLMMIYAKQNNKQMVIEQYQKLTDILLVDLNIPISAHIEKWYKRWKRDNN